MSAFTPVELEYLQSERRLARIATVGSDGTPHVAPVGFSYDRSSDAIEVRGHSLEQTKKFRDVERSGRAAIVIDDVLPPWQPRGVEIRGRAEVIRSGEPVIRIHPDRVIGWGLDTRHTGAR